MESLLNSAVAGLGMSFGSGERVQDFWEEDFRDEEGKNDFGKLSNILNFKRILSSSENNMSV